MELPYGDDGLGRKEATTGDADVPISLRVFRVAYLLQVVASSPQPARGAEFKSDEGRGRGDGRATLMITARLRTHPRSPPVPGFDRPLFSFASTYSRARTPSEEVSVIGRGFLFLLHLRLVKKQTRSTPLRTSLARSVRSS